MPTGWVAPPLRSSGGGIRRAHWRKAVREWWKRQDAPVTAADHLPATFVRLPVMPAAEQDEVVRLGHSVMRPVLEVMDLSP